VRLSPRIRRYGSINFPFTAPVSEVYPAIPADYDSIVSRRMDLRTVKCDPVCVVSHLSVVLITCLLLRCRETLDREGYAVPKDFLADVKLVFDNALLYNKNLKGMPNGEYELAAAMMRAFEREWGELSVHALEHFERVGDCVRLRDLWG
jgi:Bromodomain